MRFWGREFCYSSHCQSNKRGQTYKDIAKTHEYILIYTKHDRTNFNELEKETNDLIYSDKIGAYSIRELRNRNQSLENTTVKSLLPNSCI